jgi:hypothetical protein
MKVSKSKGLTISLLFLFIISACSGGGGSSDSGGTGTLSASLTDSAGSYKAVYITVESLEVHTGGNDNNKNNWETIDMDLDTINLCELTNGVFVELGSIRLDSGKYTQLRLHLSEDPENTDELNILSQIHPAGNYVILEDNSVHELKIPSGFQTGVKLVKEFTINDNQTTEIRLDFDASRSVVEAGNSGQWLLKPTIQVGELKEYSIIEGMVTDSDGNGIPDAMVSAQYFDGSELDDKDKVIVQAATITDANGDYSLFVKPGLYNLVAYADNKEFDIRRITTTEGEVLDDPTKTDFQLNDATTTGTINGKVEITGASIDQQYATISYRVSCPDPACATNEMIEIDSINVLNTSVYEIKLPTDSYNRVASTFGYHTQSQLIDVLAGINNDPNIHNIRF